MIDLIREERRGKVSLRKRKDKKGELKMGVAPLNKKIFPLSFEGEELNTMDSYMCSLVQNSESTN